MRHLNSGRKLKRTNSHRKALLMNLATSLLQHKRLQTTEAKAKELRPFVEQIITRAKNAYLRERNGQLPAGQTVDVHARRIVGRIIHNKGVLQELFDAIAPVVESRPGGYTRITKLGQRRGDGSKTAVIELVDYYAEQDGATSLSRTKKRRVSRTQQAPKAETANVQDALEQSVAAAVTSIEANVAQEASAEAASDVETPAVEEASAQDNDTNTEPSSDGEGDDTTQK